MEFYQSEILGPKFVTNLNLMSALISWLGNHHRLKFQLINKRCYEIIIPHTLYRVAIPKSLKPFIRMGEDIDPKKVICKHKQKVIVSDLPGFYNGEVDIATEIPHGRGVF